MSNKNRNTSDNLGGRPKFKPTDEQRLLVKNLVAAGTAQDRICLCILNGKKPIDANTLRKHFRDELDTSIQWVTGMAMSRVVNGIVNHKQWAIQLWLRTRAGWSETAAHRVVDESGKDRPLTLGDIDAIIAAADAADEAAKK